MADLASQTRRPVTEDRHAATFQAGSPSTDSAPLAGGQRVVSLVRQHEMLNRSPHVVALQRVATMLRGPQTASVSSRPPQPVSPAIQLKAVVPINGDAAVVQRIQIEALLGDAEDAGQINTQLGDLIVNRPGDDEAEQAEFADALVQAAGFWQGLGANEIGDAAADQRLGLIAALLEGDAPAGLQRLMRYFFGLAGRPHDAARGIGTLGLARNEAGGIAGIVGRPGLFAIPTGAASQARRHITAWHTLRNLMNRIIANFDAHDLSEISREIVDVVDPEIARQATDIAQREAGEDGVEFRILWLAIVLNNVPHNLWLGAARENISINTLAGFIVRWTDELRAGDISIAVYRDRLTRYNAGSPMARRIIQQLLHEMDQPHVTEPPETSHLAIYEIVQREIRPQLEIDPRRREHISPLQLFLYEAGEGAVVVEEIGHLSRALRDFVRDPAEDDGEQA